MAAAKDRPPPATDKELTLWLAAVVADACFGSLGLPDESLDAPAVFHAATLAAVKTIVQCPAQPHQPGRAVLDEYRLQHLTPTGG